MTRKILITGSREFTNTDMVRDALTEQYHLHPGDMIVIHGDAGGADSIANALATQSAVATVVRVPADWANRKKAAGPIRNSHMLDLNPDVVLAFYKKNAGNRGTQNCVTQAEEREIEVRKFYSD